MAQAGASDEGVDLAGRFADVVFTPQPTIDAGVAFRARLRASAERHGRAGDDIRALPGLSFVLGSTDAEARAGWDELIAASSEEFRYRNLAHLAGVDPAAAMAVDPDGPFPYELFETRACADVRRGGHPRRARRRPDVPAGRREVRDAARRPALHRHARGPRRPDRELVARGCRRRVHAAAAAAAARPRALRRPRRADPAPARGRAAGVRGRDAAGAVGAAQGVRVARTRDLWRFEHSSARVRRVIPDGASTCAACARINTRLSGSRISIRRRDRVEAGAIALDLGASDSTGQRPVACRSLISGSELRNQFERSTEARDVSALV